MLYKFQNELNLSENFIYLDLREFSGFSASYHKLRTSLKRTNLRIELIMLVFVSYLSKKLFYTLLWSCDSDYEI